MERTGACERAFILALMRENERLRANVPNVVWSSDDTKLKIYMCSNLLLISPLWWDGNVKLIVDHDTKDLNVSAECKALIKDLNLNPLTCSITLDYAGVVFRYEHLNRLFSMAHNTSGGTIVTYIPEENMFGIIRQLVAYDRWALEHTNADEHGYYPLTH
jgi:hypothetical protein